MSVPQLSSYSILSKGCAFLILDTLPCCLAGVLLLSYSVLLHSHGVSPLFCCCASTVLWCLTTMSLLSCLVSLLFLSILLATHYCPKVSHYCLSAISQLFQHPPAVFLLWMVIKDSWVCFPSLKVHSELSCSIFLLSHNVSLLSSSHLQCPLAVAVSPSCVPTQDRNYSSLWVHLMHLLTQSALLPSCYCTTVSNYCLQAIYSVPGCPSLFPSCLLTLDGHEGLLGVFSLTLGECPAVSYLFPNSLVYPQLSLYSK